MTIDEWLDSVNAQDDERKQLIRYWLFLRWMKLLEFIKP